MQLSISGYSTALFSTWYFIEELGLLFDAGDGVMSQLLQKSRKIKTIFLSHADRDHLTGLLQLNQLNARPGFPKIYFPTNCNSIYAMETFSKNFDRQVKQTEWLPLEQNEEVEISKNVVVRAIRNNHVLAANNVAKSFSYLVQYKKQKLRDEYLSLNQKEIIALKAQSGAGTLTVEVRENILGYSGDTPVENFDFWNNTDILIHEATFIDRNDLSHDPAAHNKHSLLEHVIRAASSINLKTLILGHFSSRYSTTEIKECIIELCIKYNIRFPVYAMVPGLFVHDVTAGSPVYKPLES